MLLLLLGAIVCFFITTHFAKMMHLKKSHCFGSKIACVSTYSKMN